MARDSQTNSVSQFCGCTPARPFLPGGSRAVSALELRPVKQDQRVRREFRIPTRKIPPDFNAGIAIVDEEKINASLPNRWRQFHGRLGPEFREVAVELLAVDLA